jgi:hypothetical protein
MTVPSSGAISMLGLAREKVYSNYGAAGTPTAPYTMKDLAEGGNSGGSGVSFEATNTTAPYPDDDTPHGMNEWRSYEHSAALPSFTLYYFSSKASDCSDVCSSSNTVTVYSNTATSAADIFANERTIYSDSAGTTLAASWWYAAGTSAGNNCGKWSGLTEEWVSTATCGE